ncbi:hypothetical protein TWF694_001975 [Orbilia ellipsospora]|uniref:F-box domain-containing protein n=1 Tax=Orbilia ellipsospora TaxID=2528407 RepID=A0AAV9X4H7_9PEZI
MPRKARKTTQSSDNVVPLDAKPHAVLLIPELLELIITFAVHSYPEDEAGSTENLIKATKDLWCNYRLVCKFWKEIIETSTLPDLASLTLNTTITVKDDRPAPKLTICPLAIKFATEVCKLESPPWYWSWSRRTVPGWAARMVDKYRGKRYPKRLATYPAVTGMRAKATSSAVRGKRIQRVNSYYLKQRRTEVSWDEQLECWYFESESEITAQNLVAFVCGVYEACGSNSYHTGVPFVRVELLRPDEGVVGHVDIPCKI